MSDGLLDCAAWKAMLDRDGVPAADASIGVLTKEDFAARHGRVLVWRGTFEGANVTLRSYRGDFDADVAMLLVADRDALAAVLADGLAQVAPLVRRGKLHPYMLRTLEDLEDAGLSDFVEDFGLVFPRH
ncbi:hypothetical protein [Aromatoleum aromaticum]|uniref:Uncharacterized protein n=1 Tax=Aromatoleum aromaticum (strain DSM 19018 / LMG 30748 / EbN1) TaxID=76114 RepID=Q5P5Y0_AROAE|nr:hypothetical protein [Aromatoleum aromaticum]NMG54313.1 hypothetical protein [Aromatoleum aromaticum]CAI07281.1 hypothetical protein ebD54 [Aromatoleum aromaticum EbN1]